MKRKLLFAALCVVSALGFNAHAEDEDYTSYITHADLSSKEGWTLAETTTDDKWSDVDGSAPSYVLEAYAGWSNLNMTAYSIKQNVTLPSGKYRAEGYAFYRYGLTYDVDPSISNAKFVAGDFSSKVVTLGSVTLDETLTAYPNSRSDASTAFTNGYYKSEIEFAIESESTIEFGYEGTHTLKQSWFIAGPIKLYRTGDFDYSLYQSQLESLVTTAKGLQSSAMAASVSTALASVVTTYDGQSCASVAAYSAAFEELNTAIDNAEASIALYATFNTAITKLKAQNSASVDLTAIDTKYNNGTYTAVSGIYADYQSIVIAGLGTADNTDYTSVILNPSFEFGDMTGWTTPTSGGDTGVKTIGASGDTYYMTNADGTYLFNNWDNSIKTLNLTQTVSGLPSGRYQLKAVVAGYADGAAIYLKANSSVDNVVPEVAGTEGYEISVDFSLATGDDLVIEVYNTGKGWTFFKADHFQLTLVSTTVSSEASAALLAKVPESTVMNGTVLSTLTSTKTDFEGNASIDNYAALETAIANAETSIEAYAAAAAAVAKANTIKEANNFVTADATTTFAAAIAAISDAYDARTLSDADANAAGLTLGTSVSNWHANASAAAVAYISSAWSEITMPSDNSQWSAYYINTWSTEGDKDGSGFSVPFFEYWVGSGSLAAKTMTATLDDLTAGQLYKLTADVRVQYSSKVDGSITLTVGEGAAVDVTSGAQIGSSNLYLGTFNAFGKADEDGKLTVTFNVAAGSGISWLSWQNVTYEATNLDFTDLNVAITAANAVNAKVTNGVASLTTAISTASALLTSATTQDEVDAGVTALNSAVTNAEAIVAARLKLAGTVKKATALKSYIDEDIDAEISEATAYANNADATAAEATSKTNALNAHFSAWTTVSLTNAGFDTDISAGSKVSGTDHNYDITGWTFVKNGTKWDATHSISTAYGAAATDGTNSTAAPSANMYGETDGGVMHISAGWGETTRYEQEIESLPAGKYVVYYEAYNANSSATTISSNYFGVNNLTSGSIDGTNNSFIFSDDKSYTYNDWTTHVTYFNLIADVTSSKMNIGVTGNSGGSAATAKLWIDNVTIYRIGNADATISEELASAPAAASDVNVTLTRTLKGGQWNGFSVPFGFTVEGSALDGAEVKKFASVSENEITLEDATAIEAGEPYLVKPVANENADIVNPTFEGVAVTAATDVVKGEGAYTFQAHLYNTALATDGSVAYVSTTDSSIKKLTSGSIKGLRAIFNIPVPTEENSVKALVVRFHNTPTGILTVDAEGNMIEGAIYNLAGQRVQKTQKGIYIVGGKKVAVK